MRNYEYPFIEPAALIDIFNCKQNIVVCLCLFTAKIIKKVIVHPENRFLFFC